MSAEIVQFGKQVTVVPNRPTEEAIRSTLYDCWVKDPIWWRTDFAHRLRLLREVLHISEQEAAAALFVSVRTYRRYERAERIRNNHFGVMNLAKVFGVSLDWLIAGEGPVLLPLHK